MPSPIMQHFAYKHLPFALQMISKPICELAWTMEADLPPGPEKSAGLRKLMEAKDCFVRAALPPVAEVHTPKPLGEALADIIKEELTSDAPSVLERMLPVRKVVVSPDGTEDYVSASISAPEGAPDTPTLSIGELEDAIAGGGVQFIPVTPKIKAGDTHTLRGMLEDARMSAAAQGPDCAESAAYYTRLADWLEELEDLRLQTPPPYIRKPVGDMRTQVLVLDPAKDAWVRTEVCLLRRGDVFRCIAPGQPEEEWEVPSIAAGNPQLHETREKGVYQWCISVEDSPAE